MASVNLEMSTASLELENSCVGTYLRLGIRPKCIHTYTLASTNPCLDRRQGTRQRQMAQDGTRGSVRADIKAHPMPGLWAAISGSGGRRLGCDGKNNHFEGTRLQPPVLSAKLSLFGHSTPSTRFRDGRKPYGGRKNESALLPHLPEPTPPAFEIFKDVPRRDRVNHESMTGYMRTEQLPRLEAAKHEPPNIGYYMYTQRPSIPPITHSLFDLCTRERLLTLRDLKVNVRIYKDKNGLKLASYYVCHLAKRDGTSNPIIICASELLLEILRMQPANAPISLLHGNSHQSSCTADAMTTWQLQEDLEICTLRQVPMRNACTCTVHVHGRSRMQERWDDLPNCILDAMHYPP
ncbi:predicted protein [Histoplasma capsulatum H143]|uniref:Uncharacterized protein n=1 Tax=Ajellomyces capsulatus (strain H143) TaxID=544712 RepID=C6H5K9_AJECH|nr:predicted protein [Histoplasma capsulatum H143]